MGGLRLTLNDACDVAIKRESARNSNTWCPKCVIDSQRIGINVVKDITKLRGGEYLSALYLNTRTPLIWKCCQGHEK
ncbi:hypothetical protein Glove_461g80 [Diversispora epigaea]|uniref:Uncharacterized protein n=1 Tax=Diversispora epigaea TaxID=1348612 RepID=A0A397GSB0_9GLOM|nr:hypothetical protein Glove_461g80 [Diversispora epigaea]